MKMQIPPNANFIIQKLKSSGFQAYAVGGCVRNAMMGLPAHDWDICTNAKPDEMKSVFRGFSTYDFGLKHGTLVVYLDNETFEVTTYRIDGAYADNRHPEQVTFTGDVTLDLSRRDFTVNAMAYNDDEGIIDPFHGAKDLQKNLLRCVGVPDKRFNEDALRILRGLRFSSVYGFDIEKQTAQAIHANAALLKNIAQERIREELTGLLCGKNVLSVLTAFRDVLAVVIPEIAETFDFEQKNKHHCYDVWRHIIHTVERIEPNPLLRVSMLLHDLGKPRACTTDELGFNHFKGHQQISVEMGEIILKRLRFPNDFIKDCLQLVLYHDVRYDGSQRQMKRLLQTLGEENLQRLFAVQRADVAAQSDYQRAEKLAAIALAEQQAGQILAQEQCFSLRQLAVNGNDLKQLGVTDGKEIGRILNTLLNAVIDGELPNEKAVLLQKVTQISF